MGIYTLHPSVAPAACGRLQSASRYLSGLLLAGVCAFSSASVHAGICGISRQNSQAPIERISAGVTDSLNSDVDATAPTLVASSKAIGTDPLSADPMARGTLLSAYNIRPANWTIPEPSTGVVGNVLPKSTETLPLLIPLPTAASAGAWGLVAVAALLTAKRTLRRRLLA